MRCPQLECPARQAGHWLGSTGAPGAGRGAACRQLLLTRAGSVGGGASCPRRRCLPQAPSSRHAAFLVWTARGGVAVLRLPALPHSQLCRWRGCGTSVTKPSVQCISMLPASSGCLLHRALARPRCCQRSTQYKRGAVGTKPRQSQALLQLRSGRSPSARRCCAWQHAWRRVCRLVPPPPSCRRSRPPAGNWHLAWRGTGLCALGRHAACHRPAHSTRGPGCPCRLPQGTSRRVFEGARQGGAAAAWATHCCSCLCLAGVCCAW